MKLNATNLRANLYKILDQVIESGVPIEIERKGKILMLVPAEHRNKLSNLSYHPDVIVGDAEDLVHMDWSDYWKYDNDLS